METQIDHLVVVARTREAGMEYVFERLGIIPELGGKHERLGTHNALLKLGQKVYLEVIAIDPEAPEQRPRLFGLDDLEASAPPRLATWVVRTNDISSIVTSVSLGCIEPMSRGTFKWLITIPPDGLMPMNGAIPTLIQWLVDVHPCDSLKESGCELLALEIHHPEAELINNTLRQLGFASPLVHCRIHTSMGLRATIKTPRGILEL